MVNAKHNNYYEYINHSKGQIHTKSMENMTQWLIDLFLYPFILRKQSKQNVILVVESS